MDEFAKLVDIKAYTKILVCYPKADEVDDLISGASKMVRFNPLKLPEERYLIIALIKIRRKASFTGVILDFAGNPIGVGQRGLPRKEGASIL